MHAHSWTQSHGDVEKTDDMDAVTAFAPATVSNVACGFDVLGFALHEPGDEVTARWRQSSRSTPWSERTRRWTRCWRARSRVSAMAPDRHTRTTSRRRLSGASSS